MKTPTLEDIGALAVRMIITRRSPFGGNGTGHSAREMLKELTMLVDRLPHEVRRSLWRRGGKPVDRV